MKYTIKKRNLAVVLTVALGLSAVTGLVSNAELGQGQDPQATPIVTEAPDANATATPDVNATIDPNATVDPNATANPDVTVPPTEEPAKPATTISFGRVTIKKGKSVNLKTYVKGADSVKFYTSEKKVAKITKRYPKLVKVQGKGLGTAIITAKANGVKATFRVKVVK
jgi:hypothetical protein